MKRICVIDGQGGGIGATLIKCLKEAYGESVELIGLGTNAIASAQMLKAGANRCASGENAIVQTVATADLIAGPVSITWPNAMLGEVTTKMARSLGKQAARPFEQADLKLETIRDERHEGESPIQGRLSWLFFGGDVALLRL